jgi:hypothetical protein
VAVFHESDLQVCVKYSSFGERAGEGGEPKPKWSPAPFAEWNRGKEGLDFQITALVNLLATFSVVGRESDVIRIFPGMTGGSSYFSLRFDRKYILDQSRQATLLYDPATKALTLASGVKNDPVDLTNKSVEGIDSDGRHFVDIEFSPILPNDGGAWQTLEVHCSIRLRLDQSTSLPRSEDLEYRLYTMTHAGWNDINRAEASIWD